LFGQKTRRGERDDRAATAGPTVVDSPLFSSGAADLFPPKVFFFPTGIGAETAVNGGTVPVTAGLKPTKFKIFKFEFKKMKTF